jgi:hypothetical protein
MFNLLLNCNSRADINAFNATNNDTMKNLGIYAALGVSGTLFQVSTSL